MEATATCMETSATTAAHMAATAAYMGASAAAAPASATAAASAMAASAATAATGQFYVLGVRGLFAVFLVKRKKRRQATVEDFLIAEKDFLILTL
jgi:hypothetical protein